MATQTMPAVFFGHGSPMNTLEHNPHTEQWQRIGERIIAEHGTPGAIVSVSAHWYINATAVTAMPAPRTIHDFYGFPSELFAYEYPAPGDPALASEIVELLAPAWCGLDVDSWGLDHGTWSVLAHVFPDANIPVVQLAVDGSKPYGDHLELGARLAPLLDRGVFVMASGNVVHNLRRIDWGRPTGGFDWADRFDEAVLAVMRDEPAALPAVISHPDHAAAVPTPDHFIPLLYLAGIAQVTGRSIQPFNIERVMGSLSMTSYALDAA
jgi:4,5-DOPA dioxygenase extradiol